MSSSLSNTLTYDFFWREISLFVGLLKGFRTCGGGISGADVAQTPSKCIFLSQKNSLHNQELLITYFMVARSAFSPGEHIFSAGIFLSGS
jgi:hypothetical protein